MMTHKRALRDTQLLVSQGLPAGRHQRLRDHLRGCDDCLRHYERLRAVEDAITPAAVVSEAALERIGELVLADTAPKPARANPWAWASGLVASTALAVALIAVVRPADEGELTPRGASVMTQGHGLSAFVIDPARGETTRAVLPPDRRVVVPQGKVVQLAYRNTSHRYAVVVGLDATGDSQWYHPGEAERASGGVALVAGATDEPLPGAWSIDRDMAPLRLFALFGDTPIDASLVERALDRVRASGRDPRDVERLPDLPYAQDTVLLVVPEAARR